MNKITYFILLLSLIGYISTAYTCNGEESKDDCLSHKLTEKEKSEGIEMCCYGEVKDEKNCDGYTKAIADTSEAIVKELGGTFKCSSNWLNLGFSIIFFGFIFF